jgi:hypothetical protein
MLAEVTLKSLCKQIELFERAAAYDDRPRIRLVALGEAEELYYRLYPHHYRALQTIRIASQLARPSRRRDEPLRQCESTLISLLVKIILDGVKTEDLQLRSPQRPEELAFTIWILAFGTRALMDTTVARSQLGIDDGFRVTRESTDLLLDALGWQPVSSEWDFNVTRERIRRDLFSQEWAELTQRNLDRQLC